MNGFLFDENLPRRLTFTPSLTVSHATALGSKPSDNVLWDYARKADLAIVTKDNDFALRMRAASPPPRVISLEIGNMKKRDYLALLSRLWPQIEKMISEHKLVVVYNGGLISADGNTP